MVRDTTKTQRGIPNPDDKSQIMTFEVKTKGDATDAKTDQQKAALAAARDLAEIERQRATNDKRLDRLTGQQNLGPNVGQHWGGYRKPDPVVPRRAALKDGDPMISTFEGELTLRYLEDGTVQLFAGGFAGTAPPPQLLASGDRTEFLPQIVRSPLEPTAYRPAIWIDTSASPHRVLVHDVVTDAYNPVSGPMGGGTGGTPVVDFLPRDGSLPMTGALRVPKMVFVQPPAPAPQAVPNVENMRSDGGTF